MGRRLIYDVIDHSKREEALNTREEREQLLYKIVDSQLHSTRE